MGYEGMAAKIMAKHSKEEHRSSLSITVIEARGLRPRHGTSSYCMLQLLLHLRYFAVHVLATLPAA